MSDFQWMLTHSSRMDTALKRRLLEAYGSLRRFPCFLQRQTRWLLERFVTLPVIIQFDGDFNEGQNTELQALIAKSSKVISLPMINAMAVRLSVRDLQAVCDVGGVAGIALDREVKTMLDNATSTVGSRAAHARGVTGRDVTVAVIDTGIHPHPDLEGRIIAFQDFINGRTAVYDDNGHGTHCAGCVASNGSQSGGVYAGTAPEAQLVGVKVINKTGTGMLSTIIQGVEWCVRNRESYGIRVISMSLGAQANTSAANDPLVQAVEQAWNAGIVVCAAAGNEGPSSGTITSPGISPLVITVGAADDRGTLPQTDDIVADFSSRGPTIDGLVKPDVVAPGVNITSLRAPGSFVDKINSASRVGEFYFTLSGTSMATPIVAGMCAQLLQEYPTLTPQDVKNMLRAYAVSLGDTANNQGAGEVQYPRVININMDAD